LSPRREAVLERESRWALPVAVATLTAICLLVGARVVAGSVSGDGDAEVLRSIEAHRSAVILSGVMQAAGFLLLAAPLLYLFRAAQARSERVRGQLIGLVIATPVFLCAAALLSFVAATGAASDFEAGKGSAEITRSEAAENCRSERSEDSAAFKQDFGAGTDAAGACVTTQLADSEAEDALASLPANSIGFGFGLAGRLGLAFALLYSCLWAMRTGLLTRFWGSLGMAMGVAALLLLIELPLIWFLYFAILVGGWVPGGRPPAWAAGEAVPWPTPGEKAADQLAEPEDGAGSDS